MNRYGATDRAKSIKRSSFQSSRGSAAARANIHNRTRSSSTPRRSAKRRIVPCGSARSLALQFSRCWVASYAGSPRNGFGSIASHGSRRARRTFPACRSVARSMCAGALCGRSLKRGRPVEKPHRWITIPKAQAFNLVPALHVRHAELQHGGCSGRERHWRHPRATDVVPIEWGSHCDRPSPFQITEGSGQLRKPCRQLGPVVAVRDEPPGHSECHASILESRRAGSPFTRIGYDDGHPIVDESPEMGRQPRQAGSMPVLPMMPVAEQRLSPAVRGRRWTAQRGRWSGIAGNEIGTAGGESPTSRRATTNRWWKTAVEAS
jgi:hypothetical protein